MVAKPPCPLVDIGARLCYKKDQVVFKFWGSNCDQLERINLGRVQAGMDS